ncbi:hypothetical protein [Sinanaerobacter chloroacetimidivorans]|uniref:Uncharacterized protein n=1 Tax=Sinanaerobacter chloroacetimidivorans TaxID=2818044 RepID=A0A8J7W7W2_9FIRM|nr:hypothetical protein [Sinanaerobacter chloroacetimidivorans]MBR0600648.1 hypothetical protein [Sinanaerobacter chloroacetimidivorans]
MTARQTSALNVIPTAGNSRTDSFHRLIHSIVALLWRAIKGKSEPRVLMTGIYLWLRI